MKKISTTVLNWWDEDKRIVFYALLIGCVVTMIFTIAGYSAKRYSHRVQQGIANEVVRFHVLANSDSEKDQQLKIQVKDRIVEALAEDLAISPSKEDTKTLLNENMQLIIDTAETVIRENGYSYPVSAVMATTFFPTKQYGDIALPAGDYEALNVYIGDGEGQNWWCAMFPPLCFVDATQKEAPDEIKSEMQDLLSEEEYALVTSQTEDAELSVKVKFKIVELFQEREQNTVQYARNKK